MLHLSVKHEQQAELLPPSFGHDRCDSVALCRKQMFILCVYLCREVKDLLIYSTGSSSVQCVLNTDFCRNSQKVPESILLLIFPAEIH